MGSTAPFNAELRGLIRDVVRQVLADTGPLPAIEIKLGKTAAAIASGAAGTVEIYRGAKGAETHAPGDDLTGYNRGPALAAGTDVLCLYFADATKWELLPWPWSAAGEGNAAAGACTEIVGISPGWDLSPWEVCAGCGPWLIGFLMQGTIDDVDIGGTWYVEFNAADSDPTDGIWESPEFERNERTFFWRYVATAGTGKLFLIELVDSEEIVRHVWSGTHCCCENFKLTRVCIDSSDATTGTLPLTAEGLPFDVCLFPAGASVEQFEGCADYLPDGIASKWTADISGITSVDAGCPSALFNRRIVLSNFYDQSPHAGHLCNWSENIDPALDPPSGTTGYLSGQWLMSFDATTVTLWTICLGQSQLTYTIPLSSFDPQGANEFALDVQGANVTDAPATITIYPTGAVFDADGNAFPVPAADCESGGCGTIEGGCDLKRCGFESSYDEMAEKWVWTGISVEEPYSECDAEICHCPVDIKTNEPGTDILHDRTTDDTYLASDYMGQQIFIDCATEDEIIFPPLP
jgi:hypothetical protein